MRKISDVIEHYLKQIIDSSANGAVEIQRNDLAEKFSCVPSQINYVISTRFTVEKGYVVESKRGGGGFVRIQRLQLPSVKGLQFHIEQMIGNTIDQVSAEGLIYQLKEAGHLTLREANMLNIAIHRDHLQLKLPYRDELRARLLKAMLITIMMNEK